MMTARRCGRARGTGSPLYVAPEVLKPQRYNHSADLWGAGMLAYMILTAQLPFATVDASVSVADLYTGAASSPPPPPIPGTHPHSFSITRACTCARN